MFYKIYTDISVILDKISIVYFVFVSSIAICRREELICWTCRFRPRTVKGFLCLYKPITVHCMLLSLSLSSSCNSRKVVILPPRWRCCNRTSMALNFKWLLPQLKRSGTHQTSVGHFPVPFEDAFWHSRSFVQKLLPTMGPFLERNATQCDGFAFYLSLVDPRKVCVVPFLAFSGINRLRHRLKVSTDKSSTNSRWTALVTQHVKRVM